MFITLRGVTVAFGLSGVFLGVVGGIVSSKTPPEPTTEFYIAPSVFDRSLKGNKLRTALPPVVLEEDRRPASTEPPPELRRDCNLKIEYENQTICGRTII